MKQSVLLFLALFCVSCGIVVRSASDDCNVFAKNEIKLPVNYNQGISSRKLLMGVVVQNAKIDPKTGKHLTSATSANAALNLSQCLQTEMAKLKRFSVFSTFNRGGVTFFQSLEDVGDANKRELDLILTLDIIPSCKIQERATDNLLIYEAEINARCEDLKTHETKFMESAKGQVMRVEKLPLTGKRMGVYNQDDERQLFLQAALKAISIIAIKVAKHFPVNGRITCLQGDRMLLDCGFEHGVRNDMQMVVYTPDNGIDVPIALTVASPSEKTAALKVVRWNKKNKIAKRIISEIKQDVEWLDKHECRAVEQNVGVPNSMGKLLGESEQEMF